MYVICYTLTNGEKTWEIVSWEDAMQIRADELMDDLLLYEDEVMVFEMDSQL